MIFTAHQAAGILLCRNMTEMNVVREGAEERDSLSDENRDASDDDTLNESAAQEALNCDSAIDVEVVGAAGG